MNTVQQQEQYWRRCLSNRPASVALPSAGERPPVSAYVRAAVRTETSAAVAPGLRALASREGVSLRSILMAGFATLLFRHTGQDDIIVGTSLEDVGGSAPGKPAILRARLAGDLTVTELVRQVEATFKDVSDNCSCAFQKLLELARNGSNEDVSSLFNTAFVMVDSKATVRPAPLSEMAEAELADCLTQCDLVFGAREQNGGFVLDCEFDAELFETSTAERLLENLQTLLTGMASSPAARLDELPLLSPAERQKLLVEWNQTQASFPQDRCVHQAFEAQVERTPDAIAAVFQDQQLTYRELSARANRLAHHLISLGVGPEVLVGICVDRSLEMLIGLLAILKAGGAYVPLDPVYPRERLGFMLEDAHSPVLLTERRLLDKLPPHAAKVICLDSETQEFDQSPDRNPSVAVTSDNLAYVIYTSGSTGKPKGVMVTHRNVANFFVGMDQSIGSEPGARDSVGVQASACPASAEGTLKRELQPGVWLALTSISFDISVLELFWTLARGFKVVIGGDDRVRHKLPARQQAPRGSMDFSLFYFSSDAGQDAEDRYRLLLEGAKFADENGFLAVWTPERHFHAFGGLYPNPSVTGAAVAAVTQRVRIMAGSVVLPLHNPIRVAEEWAVVDNLSKGRVGVSFATGWQVNDFVLAPQNYEARKEVVFREIETVRKLWRGETVSIPGVNGQGVAIKTLPRPVQRELPISITATGNPETFRIAGELGADLLTHLIGQKTEDLAEKIAIYRQARRAKGHAGDGHVTLMLHTFVGDDLESVRETVRQPFTNYLKSSVELIKNCPWAFTPARLPAGAELSEKSALPAKELSPDEMRELLAHAFELYFENTALFGTPEVCLRMVNQLKAIGVDEIACLIDFGVASELVLDNLRHLKLVRERSNEPVEKEADDSGVAALIARHQITHLQCTPSLAAMLLAQPDTRAALGRIRQLLVGGEALPVALARQLREATPATIHNMYGPTETTVWSTTQTINEVKDAVSIGRPIANTKIYLLDPHLELVPIGVAGELCIGGDGVVRGYLNRPELTAERFIANPFGRQSERGLQAASTFSSGQSAKRPEGRAPGDRLYRTGDLARYQPDGTIEFIGRMDHQVKLRGYRIELGEIEAVLNEHPTVGQAVVIAREDDPGNKRLVVYVTPADGQKPAASQLRSYLKEKLPEYMLPAGIVMLKAFPQTPNQKIDRKALPPPGKGHSDSPQTEIEQALADLWVEVLGVPQVNRNDDFFRLGGDASQADLVTHRIQQTCHVPLSNQTLVQSPVLADFAKKLEETFLEHAGAEWPALTLASCPAVFPAMARLEVDGESDLENRAARTPVERTLATLWGELLHRDQVMVRDNFFELGGHSLIATQMVSRLRATFQIELPLRVLFESPTVAGLSAVIEKLRGQTVEPPYSALVPLPRKTSRARGGSASVPPPVKRAGEI